MTMPLHLACYSDLRAWMRRKRRVLLLAAGVVGAGCMIYGIRRYNSRARENVEEERARALLQQDGEEQLRHHFEVIQVISDTTTLPATLQHIKERLAELIDLSGLTQQLLAGKDGTMNHEEKMHLWQRLKILSFTRVYCVVCGLGLADLFVRVQLNLLGRHMYINAAESKSHLEVSMTGHRRFLSFADYLPSHGITLLVEDTEKAVESILKDVSLKKPYSYAELTNLLSKIREVFEDGNQDWSKYLLPVNNKVPADMITDPSTSTTDENEYETLLMQTRDVVTSGEFSEAFAAAMDTLLELIMTDMSRHYDGQTDTGRGTPLARLVPPISSLSTLVLENLEENKYILAIAALPQVKSFCAMVYGGTA